jgi:hypothetical protein
LDDAGEDAWGVIVDWLLVELGTLEALPITSGESVIEQIVQYIKDVVHWHKYVPPTLCANDAFHKSDCGCNEKRLPVSRKSV